MHSKTLSPRENLSRALSQHRMLTLKPYNIIRPVHVFSHTLCLDSLYCEITPVLASFDTELKIFKPAGRLVNDPFEYVFS